MIASQVKQLSKEAAPYFSADDVLKIKSFSKSRSKVKSSSVNCHLQQYESVLFRVKL